MSTMRETRSGRFFVNNAYCAATKVRATILSGCHSEATAQTLLAISGEYVAATMLGRSDIQPYARPANVLENGLCGTVSTRTHISCRCFFHAGSMGQSSNEIRLV